MKKRILSLLFTFAFVFAMVPAYVTTETLAAGNDYYTIDIMGGTATNAAGEVITGANVGEKVTITADAPAFGQIFDMWMTMGEGADLEDPYASTTTFIMPARDVIIFSGYTVVADIPVTSLSVSLTGFHTGNNVMCMQPIVGTGATLATVPGTGLPYALFMDNNGKPAASPTTNGTIRANGKYWLGLILEPASGYTLEGFTAANVDMNGAGDIVVTTNSTGQTVVMIQLPKPTTLAGKNVTVTDGTAFLNNTAVTIAYTGQVLYLQADEAPAGMHFSRWEVISGGVTPLNIYNPATNITVGKAAIEIRAVYEYYIDTVKLDIPMPNGGVVPEYRPIPVDADGYQVDSETEMEHFCMGMAWKNLDTEKYLIPGEDVVEAGVAYQVQILLKALPGRQFNLTDDYPNILTTVNGVGAYAEQYTLDSSRYIMVTYSYNVDPSLVEAAIYQNNTEIMTYTNVNDAIFYCGEGQRVVLLDDTQADAVLYKDLYIDMNGYDLRGTINPNGYKVYGLDTVTDGYCCDGVGYFDCYDQNYEKVVPQRHFKNSNLKRYMAIEDENGYSFHRFYIGITHVTIKPSTVGLGYKAVFAGDSMVMAELDAEKAFAFELWLEGNPSVKAYKEADQLYSMEEITLRLQNIDAENYGETNINACVRLTLSDGTVITSGTSSNSLRGVLQILNDKAASLNGDEVTALRAMIANSDVMQNWNLYNLYGVG